MSPRLTEIVCSLVDDASIAFAGITSAKTAQLIYEAFKEDGWIYAPAEEVAKYA